MADLVLEFGADITQFKGNIGQVIDGLKKFREQAKTASVSELPELNKKIAEYVDGLKRLKAVGVPATEGFKKIEDNAKGARVALTSVNQVVQDLPFGFIGIQNNLPALFSSFSKLNSSTEGVIGSFKNLDKATLITSSLFLAFNIATAAVTFLIQKYGSLGAAFDTLFGKTNLAVKAQEDYNKALAEATGSSATEVAEIKILVGVLTDLNKPLKERQAAYVELEKIRPEVIAGQKLENISTEEATRLIKENSTAVLNLILLKAKEAAISSVLNKNAEDLVNLQVEELDLRKRITKADQDYVKNSQGNNFDEISARLKKGLTEDLAKNTKAQQDLNKVAQEYLTILDPTINAIAEVDRGIKEKTDAEGKAAKAAAKAKKDAEDLAKWEKIRLANLALIEKFTGKRIYEPVGQIQLTKDNVDFGKLMTKDIPIELFDIKSFQEAYDRFTQGIFDKTDSLKAILADKIKNLNLPAPTLPVLDKLSKAFFDSGLSVDEYEKKLQDTFNRISGFVSNLLINPLEAYFTDVLTKGENSWKKFGQTILDVLNKLIIKLAAAAVVAGILAVLTGGGTLAGGAPGVGAAGASGAGSFGKIFGSLLGFNKASSPTFGGVQGGGMGMSGSVNLTLRGTDLVGAINRTNTQISRVG